jgi:hypothetical protein
MPTLQHSGSLLASWTHHATDAVESVVIRRQVAATRRVTENRARLDGFQATQHRAAIDAIRN